MRSLGYHRRRTRGMEIEVNIKIDGEDYFFEAYSSVESAREGIGNVLDEIESEQGYMEEEEFDDLENEPDEESILMDDEDS